MAKTTKIAAHTTLSKKTVSASPPRQLFWAAIGIILVSGALLAVQLFYLRVQALDNGERLTESLSHVIEEQTARTLQSVDQRLQLVADSLGQRYSETGLGETAARLFLREHLREMPFVRAIWALDAQGRVKYDSDEGNIGLNLADRDYFQIYQSQPATGLFIGKPARSRTTENWLVSVARPLRPAAGKFAGVVVVALEAPYFAQVWSKAGLGTNGTIALWRRDGLLMMRSPVDEAAMGKDFSKLALFSQALPKEPIGSFQSSNTIDGQSRQVAYRTVSSHPELVVAVGQSIDAVLKPWRDFALLTLAVWGLAAAFVVTLCIFLAQTLRQRIRAEADATDKAQRLKLATDAAAIGIWDWDVKNDHWFASPICFEMLGEEPGDGVRERWADRIHPDDRAAVFDTMQKTLDGVASSYQYEARVQHADGSYRWIGVIGQLLAKDESGKASRILGVRVDITARKQVEIALRESEAANRALISAIPDFIFTNRRDGEFLAVQASDPTSLMAPPETFLNRKVQDILPPDIGNRFLQAFAVTGAAGTPEAILVIEYSLLVRGAQRHFEARVVPRDTDTVVTIVRDVTERNRTSMALRESEERFRAIWDSSVDGMRLCDTSGCIVAVNSAYCAVVGKTSEELVGQPLTAAYAVAGHAQVRQLFIDNASARKVEKYIEKELALLSGDKRWFAVSNSLLNAADGRSFVLSIFRDIGERKQAELALADSEKRFRAIVERSPDAMCVYRDSKIIYVNPAAVTMVGAQSAEQLVGRSILDLIHADSRKLVIGRLKQIADGDTQDTLTELRFRMLDGTAIDVEARGTSIIYAGLPADHVSLRDITAAKQAEAALRMSEVALAEAQRVARLGGWRWDVTTGAVEWSDELYRIFGRDLSLPPPDFEENFALYTSASATELRTAMQFAMQTGNGYKLDLEQNCTNGPRGWIGARGEVLRNGDGQIVGMRGTVQDITNRKKADAERVLLEAQLRESQKMEAIGTLAGGIAHDFNNILATILGNSELARQDLPHDSPVLDSLDEIRKAGSRARDLVRQILSFSRREATERRVISLLPVVHESVGLLRAALPSRLVLNVHHEAEVPSVLADATQIQQIIINLVNNAMQAIRGGAGRIDIRLCTISSNAELVNAPPALRSMRANHPGRLVKLAVQDDGPGMDAATQARVFEPFFTTKPVDEGTGLGLAVVHGIVLAHEGTIILDSEPGKGANFTVYLPAVENAPIAQSPTEHAAENDVQAAAGGGQHILYIDDDEALVFLVQRLLARHGYHIHGHTDQEAALAELRANPAGFELVVTDYNMPGMSGLDVARAVREIRADLPVVVASGFIDENLRAQAGGAGVRELIFKANAVEDLCDAFVRLARAASASTNVG